MTTPKFLQDFLVIPKHSELLKNLDNMFRQYYMHSDKLNMFKTTSP